MKKYENKFLFALGVIGFGGLAIVLFTHMPVAHAGGNNEPQGYHAPKPPISHPKPPEPPCDTSTSTPPVVTPPATTTPPIVTPPATTTPPVTPPATTTPPIVPSVVIQSTSPTFTPSVSHSGTQLPQNICNPLTGQTGYQVVGAQPPQGWQTIPCDSIGASPVIPIPVYHSSGTQKGA